MDKKVERSELLQRVLATDLIPGQLFRHYKGGLYQVVLAAIGEASQDVLVVYRHLEAGGEPEKVLPVDGGWGDGDIPLGLYWVRTFANWTELVRHGDSRLPRFARLHGDWNCYDVRYGDDKLCQCGHPYGRHFDSHNHMAAVGCKYCTRDRCVHFCPANPEIP